MVSAKNSPSARSSPVRLEISTGALEGCQQEIAVERVGRPLDPIPLFGGEGRRRSGLLGLPRHGRMIAKHLFELST